jgi:hypothetical protein
MKTRYTKFFKENILDKKVTGSLYKNHTWKEFITVDINEFLNTFNKPVNFENISDSLVDNFSKNFGKNDLHELKQLINKYPDGQISIIISDGGRKFKTKIPKELNNILFK